MGYYLNKMTVECQNPMKTQTAIFWMLYIAILIFLLFTLTWAENSFCVQTSRLQLPPSASCIRHSGQRATCSGIKSAFLCGTGTWPGWRRWRPRSERTTPCATAGALMFKDPGKIWRDRQSCRRRRGRHEAAALCSIFTWSSWNLQVCSMSGFAFPQGCQPTTTTVCILQMTSSDSVMFSLPLIKEEDKEPWRCSQTVGSPHSSSWSSVCSRTLFTSV